MEKLSFDIPSLIPSVASAACDTHDAEDKENKRCAAVGKKTGTATSTAGNSKPLQPLGLRTPQTLNSKKKTTTATTRREKILFTSPAASRITLSSSSVTKKTPTRSVLRYGESVESLFLISSESTEQHRQLCKSVIDGTLADDPSTWRRVLEVASSTTTTSNNINDLIRLHRRATIRFSVDMLNNDNNKANDILAIWLSFAQAHAKIGAIEEARRTFRHVENQATFSLPATFYLKLAEFERSHNSNEKVEQILLRGIQKQAQPVVKLQEALNKWKRHLQTANRQPPPKRALPASTSRSTTTKDAEQHPAKRSRGTEGGPVNSASLIASSSDIADPSVVTSSTNGRILKSATRSSKLLPSKRLSRKGLSGRATRVDPNMSSMANESESEQETESLVVAEDKTNKLRLKKVDLSYMWEWDPNSRANSTTQKEMPKNDETSDPSTATHASSVASTTTTTATGGSEKHTPQDTPGSSSETPNANKIMTKSDAILAGVNQQFLPLVHQDNILQVNGSSYAKLGVIGKGGSCKVYRALSKKCAVVAIKKVKIGGMDKKAIEGYANEISLLKRLRGNPAIIQMYDSEVDMQRQSIFVVMELGEVDLNHVLRQRALAGTCRSLNMNFIRLTWQQMLSAVHCIHEERIIHSDLKPANFLFVRGALKLIDFGIAKAIQSDDTTNIYRESHIGTLNYMSPEAILDTGSGQNGPRMKIGRASDVWSLGCILYEMVYGKTPFANLHFIQKLQAIVNPNHEITFSNNVDNEAAVDTIKQCLQRNPDERPPIMGTNGLLNEHVFLHGGKTRK